MLNSFIIVPIFAAHNFGMLRDGFLLSLTYRLCPQGKLDV